MGNLRIGYFIAGFVIGLVLLFSFLHSLPDGKLHIIFCNVGQGDAAYIRFPDGRDMLVDGGPNDSVLGCLGKHMPFWDRSLDIVVLSHPEKDHMAGLVSVFERYHIGYFLRSDVKKGTDIDTQLFSIVKEKSIPQKLVTTGERAIIGPVRLAIVWPSADQVAAVKGRAVLGVTTDSVNTASVVFWVRYGSFDALFSGDADARVSQHYIGQPLADDHVELLKVPHHGSKTGMNSAFLDWLFPAGAEACLENGTAMKRYCNCVLAVISVGKNSYGHPALEIENMLADKHIQVLTTDKQKDIEVVTDGQNWYVMSGR